MICKHWCHTCSRCIKARIKQELEGTLWCEKAYRIELEINSVRVSSYVFSAEVGRASKPFLKSQQIANPQIPGLTQLSQLCLKNSFIGRLFLIIFFLVQI